MSGKLTTHVLDTANGCPAEGVKIELLRGGKVISTAVTNADGRCDGPLLEGSEMFSGEAELIFHIGPYFKGKGSSASFFDSVPIRFQLIADEHYHVPLVCSPWSYNTYRGS